MNERILELMTEAGFDVGKLRTYPGGWPREDLLILEDFAKLIVKECANVAADHEALDIYEEIREHFGVEE